MALKHFFIAYIEPFTMAFAAIYFPSKAAKA